MEADWVYLVEADFASGVGLEVRRSALGAVDCCSGKGGVELAGLRD